MRAQARITVISAAVLTCGAAAAAVQAREGTFNTPMAGKTAAKGSIGSNYDAGKRKLRNLSVDFGCQDTDNGKPVYTTASKLGKVYATVSQRGKFRAKIKTVYGPGHDGVVPQVAGKATITIAGKMKSRPGKVTGTGTVRVDTAVCDSGTVKFSWKGTNGS
jgi:hypothetical protein